MIECTLENKSGGLKIDVICDVCLNNFLRAVASIKKSRELHGKDICKRCVTVQYNKTRPMEVRKRAGAGFADKHKGKKLEEIVGIDKARTIRVTLTNQRMGEKNHNFGGVHQRFPVRTGSFEEQFGKEKADLIKLKISLKTKGENNPMFGRPSPKGAGSGISGYYKDYYFRSLLELSCILMFEAERTEFMLCDGRKSFSFKYDGNRTYFPDFYLPSRNEFIEVKPKRLCETPQVKQKAQAVINSGFPFRFITENDICKISKLELTKLIDQNLVIIDEKKRSRVK